MAEVCRDLYRDHDGLGLVAQAIVDAVIDLIPSADGAVMSALSSRKRSALVCGTNATSATIDELQDRFPDSPRAHALRSDEPIVISDTSIETRWPSLCAAIARAQVRSVLCVRLGTGAGAIGTLSVHAVRAGVFTAARVRSVSAFAEHAAFAFAFAFASARQREQLSRGLTSRGLIGQAKGMMMERYGIDDVQAFAMLATMSQNTNTPLIDLAGGIAGKARGQRRS